MQKTKIEAGRSRNLWPKNAHADTLTPDQRIAKIMPKFPIFSKRRMASQNINLSLSQRIIKNGP